MLSGSIKVTVVDRQFRKLQTIACQLLVVDCLVDLRIQQSVVPPRVDIQARRINPFQNWQMPQNINIPGIRPIIIDMIPITNLELFLGLKEEKKKEEAEELSKI